MFKFTCQRRFSSLYLILWKREKITYFPLCTTNSIANTYCGLLHILITKLFLLPTKAVLLLNFSTSHDSLIRLCASVPPTDVVVWRPGKKEATGREAITPKARVTESKAIILETGQSSNATSATSCCGRVGGSRGSPLSSQNPRLLFGKMGMMNGISLSQFHGNQWGRMKVLQNVHEEIEWKDKFLLVQKFLKFM